MDRFSDLRVGRIQCAGVAVARQRLASAPARLRPGCIWQASIELRERVFSTAGVIVGFGGGGLFSLVEAAVPELLAARREALALCSARSACSAPDGTAPPIGQSVRPTAGCVPRVHGYRPVRPEAIERSRLRSCPHDGEVLHVVVSGNL